MVPFSNTPAGAAAAVTLSRLLWEDIYAKSHDDREREQRPFLDGLRVSVPTELFDSVVARFVREAGSSSELVLEWIKSSTQWLSARDNDRRGVHLDAFRPAVVLGAWLAGEGPGIGQTRADAEYMVWRDLRKRYLCEYSAETVRAFRRLAGEVDQRSKPQALDLDSEVVLPLISALNADRTFVDSAERFVRLFLECCRLIGYVEPRYGLGRVLLQTGSVDVDFLLAKLFGFPTNIQGFDGLFGGGGLILAEHISARVTTRGRIILVRGQFGAGKSSLALALAAEVARKEGGLAWIVPLEQTPEECRQCLETMGSGLRSEQVVLDDGDAVLQSVELDLDVPSEGAGTPLPAPTTTTEQSALIILKSPKNDIARLLERIAVHTRETRRYPLRLWVVDPINSIVGLESGGAELRDRILRILSDIKNQGANLLLVAEADSTEQKGVELLANVADVVIDLTTERRHGYSQRLIEVKKSRLQREQRGQHPFSIKPGRGINVLLSSAAVKAKVSSRRAKQRKAQPLFGWTDLDDQLGGDALWPDDVAVVRGDEGTPGAQIGHLFLLGSNGDVARDRDNALRTHSLLVSVGVDANAVSRQVDKKLTAAHRQHGAGGIPLKGSSQLAYLAIPSGFIQPGTIFQLIEEKIDQLRREGKLIDRLVFDRVQHLELGCPFIREDQTFGSTLVDLLRRRHISSLFVCGPASDSGGFLQQTLASEAGVLINLERAEFRNSQRITLQIVKTHSMRHAREKLDVEFSEDRLTLRPSLVRGDLVASTVLYFHAENQLHLQYHRQLLTSLQSIVAREIRIKSGNRTRVAAAATLGSVSAVDELQLWQIDEFQLPRLLGQTGARPLLRGFPSSQWSWPSVDDSRVQIGTGKRDEARAAEFGAVPFYNNVSVLVLHKDSQFLATPSWYEIAHGCWEFETKRKAAESMERAEVRDAPAPQPLYFDCPLETDEDYNCFFIEILLGLGLPPGELRLASPSWVASLDHLYPALALFQRLCFRAQERRRNTPRGRADALGPGWKPRPLVARHWFTTFCAFSNGLSGEERQAFKLVPLPSPADGPSVAVAGEWYLGMPTFSAAPLLGLEIVRTLTTREEELERLRRGVGLPVDSEFYSTSEGVLSEILPRMDGSELKLFSSLLARAFRRSQVNGYETIAPILASHLRYVARLEPPNVPPTPMEYSRETPELRVVRDSLIKSVRFSSANLS